MSDIRNWKDDYKAKCVDMETAFQCVRNGSKIVVETMACEPLMLLQGLAQRLRKDDIEKVTINHSLPWRKDIPYLRDEQVRSKVRYLTCFTGPVAMKDVHQGAGEYQPAFLKNWPDMYATYYDPDVAVVSLTPPDSHGFMNMGPTLIYFKAALRQAKKVIVEVNDRMPRVPGYGDVHVSEVDYIIENSFDLVEVPRPVMGDAERQIGEYVASLINDGDCLQLGIGSLPDAVCSSLTHKKGLGVHTETFSDGTMDLYLNGNIDCRNKNINEDKMVTTFAMGTKEFYKFMNENPAIMMTPCYYSNDPYVIGQNNNLVSVNSAVNVDLMGQVCAESIGTLQISGTGGMLDFIRGASISKGGKSIIAFTSTAGKGEKRVSRIIPQMLKGTPISADRNEIEYVVTEYGIANLKYKSLKERAEALIGLAHPDYRADLRRELKQMPWF